MITFAFLGTKPTNNDMVDVILGLQWGDEGKGKIVDTLAKDYDIVARFQGGPNAGHTLVIEGTKYVLHTIPSGIFRQEIINIVGNGVVIDPIVFVEELDKLDRIGLDYHSRLLLSNKVHLILPTHRMLDAAKEAAKGSEKIGSTLRGIGPSYMDKTGRNGLRLGDILQANFEQRYKSLKRKHLDLLELYPQIQFDLADEEQKWFAALERIKKLSFIDAEYFLNAQLRKGKRILAEGAQGSMLDIDFGTYPYVTSSNTITAGVCNGLGIAPKHIGEVIGVAKAYTTRVGSGPFPTELFDEAGAEMARVGHEFGATTGRPRRCGWIDMVQLRYTTMLNGVTQIALTKIDVLNGFGQIKSSEHYLVNGQLSDQMPYDLCQYEVAPKYLDHPGWNQSLEKITSTDGLPDKALQYINYIQEQLQVRISMISTGPARESIIIA